MYKLHIKNETLNEKNPKEYIQVKTTTSSSNGYIQAVFHVVTVLSSLLVFLSVMVTGFKTTVWVIQPETLI